MQCYTTEINIKNIALRFFYVILFLSLKLTTTAMIILVLELSFATLIFS